MSSSESFLNVIETSESEEIFGDGSIPYIFLDSGVKLPIFYASDSSTVIFHEYKSKKKENFRMVSLIPSLLVFYFATGTRFRLAQYGQDGPLFLCSFILYLIETAVFTTFFVAHVVIALTPKSCRDRLSYNYCQKYITYGFFCRIEDFIGVIATLVNGTCLLARVNAGQCADSVSFWETDSCNPVAALRSIPSDQVFLLYAAPLATQCLVRGITAEAVLLSWILTAFFVVFAICQAKAWTQMWTGFYMIFFMNFSYEIERFYQTLFTHNRRLLSAFERHGIAQQRVHAQQKNTENDVREREATHLRILMGNVAHDLKTPLHSIEADIEVLNLFVSRIPGPELRSISEDFQKKCTVDIFDPRSIFSSLNSTCRFMEMAINRGQDFMRASNNIPLIPSMTTYDLKGAIEISVACINQIQTSRSIVIHAFNSKICSHITSDKHWLRENILCLLSNATKFSDSGTIDVRLQIVALDDSKTESSGHPTPYTGRRTIRGFTIFEGDDISKVNLQKFDQYNRPKDGALILVSVEDSGIGVSSDYPNCLFLPSKQTDRASGGVGLGLYSLSKRTEALGGCAGLISPTESGYGSKFWFAFPYLPNMDIAMADALLESASVRSEQEKVTQMFGPRQILVVDDSLSILKVTSRLLKINGHTAITASNGAIGLDMLKAAAKDMVYSMVLTDIQMPVMDGLEATKLFRKFETEFWESENYHGEKKQRLLIVGMSANTDDDTRRQALDSGMDYFIPKPFAYKDLQILLSGLSE
jgi:CheY-like chemotaxis protein